jgi:hypothetical protein
MIQKVKGKVLKVDISEIDGFCYGIVTMKPIYQDRIELKFDEREYEGEIPQEGAWAKFEYNDDGIPKLLKLRALRTPAKKAFAKPLPPSTPDPIVESNFLTNVTMLLLIVFGGVTLFAGLADSIRIVTHYIWSVVGLLIVIFSFSVRYKEPEILFDEIEGTTRYGFSTIFELIFTWSAFILWTLQASLVFDFGIDMANAPLIVLLGVICTILISWRVIRIYNRMFREALSETIIEKEPH